MFKKGDKVTVNGYLFLFQEYGRHKEFGEIAYLKRPDGVGLFRKVAPIDLVQPCKEI